MLRRLGLQVDIKPGERYNFSQLFFQSFLTGLATSFFSVTTSSYFIKKLDVSRLPFAYILSGLVGYLVIYFYKRIMNRYGLVAGIIVTNLLYVLICGSLLYARLHDGSSVSLTQYVAFAGFVFIMPFSSLFALSFATLSLRIFDLGQSKRLIALIGLGEVLASILAYILVPFLTKWMGSTAYLLLITITSVLLGIIPVTRLARANRERIRHVHFSKTTTKVNFSFLLKDKYFLLIGVFTFFSVSAIYVADYSYLLSVKFLSVENNIETAVLVSMIFLVIKVGELLFSFFSSRFISEHGMKLSLLLLPMLLAISSISGFVSGSIFQSVSFFIVAFLLVNKWVERVIRKGITNPALKVLYQVTQPGERAKVQTLIDGTLSQVSTIAAGLILLALALGFKTTALYLYLFILAGVCFVLYAGWLFYTNKLYARYKEKIQLFLKSNDASTADAVAGADALQQWLSSDSIAGSVDASVRELATAMNGFSHTDRRTREYAYTQVANYNHKVFKNLRGYKDELVPRKLSGVLYGNEYYPGKIAAIHYARYLPAQERIKLVRNNYEVLDHTLQTLLLTTINEEPLQCAPEDRFYFTECCRRCVEDILWIELTLEDIAPAADEKLNDALAALKEEKIFQLMQLFRVLYDAGSIAIVDSIWQKRLQVPENHVFAIELLENILDKDMKKVIVPLLEDIPMQAKKDKLREVFYFHHFDVADRLKDIVMKDFNLIDPYIKELAVIRYMHLTGDKKIAKVFKNHPYIRLSSLSLEQDEQYVLERTRRLSGKIGLPEDWYELRLFDVLARWVVQNKENKTAGAAIEDGAERTMANLQDNNEQYHVDCYGLCLLLETAASARRQTFINTSTN